MTIKSFLTVEQQKKLTKAIEKAGGDPKEIIEQTVDKLTKDEVNFILGTFASDVRKAFKMFEEATTDKDLKKLL